MRELLKLIVRRNLPNKFFWKPCPASSRGLTYLSLQQITFWTLLTAVSSSSHGPLVTGFSFIGRPLGCMLSLPCVSSSEICREYPFFFSYFLPTLLYTYSWLEQLFIIYLFFVSNCFKKLLLVHNAHTGNLMSFNV